MNGAWADALLAAFAVFCRLGSALMIMPGIGSARVPPQVRLLLAVAASLAVTPLLYGRIHQGLMAFSEDVRLYVLVNEVATGGAMGLMARLFLIALEFSATTAASAIGLAGVPGQPIEAAEALPPLANLVSVAGVMVLMAAGLPEQMLGAAVQSYGALPLRVGLDTSWFMANILSVLADTTLLALRLAGPFIVYGVVVNAAMGLANRFTPQVQMYFASLGLVTMGGLVLLLFSERQLLHVFADAFTAWIEGS